MTSSGHTVSDLDTLIKGGSFTQDSIVLQDEANTSYATGIAVQLPYFTFVTDFWTQARSVSGMSIYVMKELGEGAQSEYHNRWELICGANLYVPYELQTSGCTLSG